MTDREALIMLNMIEGLGPKRIEVLLSRLDKASSVFGLNRATLTSLLGERLSLGVLKQRESADFFKELRLLDKENIETLSVLDKEYSALLKEIYDPPPLLYIKGAKECLSKSCFGIVGSRRASYYGLDSAQKFSFSLSYLGFVIVSGLARGIDTSAHKGALKARGATVAVLGSGLLNIYPPENKRLAQEIQRIGCLVSEFPLTADPLRGNFPRRNRIISGLSQGVLVVEAAQKSGALITANTALEQGRDVFCLPGKINSDTSKGTHSLIKQGACLVDSPEDIVQELGIPAIETLEGLRKVDLRV